MAPARHYLHRGTLSDCLLALVARSGTFPTGHLSIISNDRSRYYGLVDDQFLTQEPNDPDDGHMRIVIRCTDPELTTIAATFDTLQGDLFDPPKTLEEKPCRTAESTNTETPTSLPSEQKN